MMMPRFTIRTALVGVTCCAVAFVVIGMAVRGESWAWGMTIGLVSLVVTLAVHAAWFWLVWMFARLPAASEAAPATVVAGVPDVRPSELIANSSDNRIEAKR